MTKTRPGDTGKKNVSHHTVRGDMKFALPTIDESKSFKKELYGSTYRRLVNKYPFWLFGFPFIGIMVAGSFFLTPATALRYERHDNKVKHVSHEEALNVGKNKRRVDMKEEYYVSLPQRLELDMSDICIAFGSQGS